MSYQLFVIEGAILSNFDGVPAERAWEVLVQTIMVSPKRLGRSFFHTLTVMAEFCYRIQYPIRNNRHRGDPFSLRQIGICQKSHGPHSSTWMILQPSAEVLSRLEMIIEKSEYFSMEQRDPMFLHLVFLGFQSAAWDDYVEHLRMEIEPLVGSSSARDMPRFQLNILVDRSSTFFKGRSDLQISQFRLCCRFRRMSKPRKVPVEARTDRTSYRWKHCSLEDLRRPLARGSRPHECPSLLD